MVWDRRATSRQSASKMYLDSIENGEVPFGCALKLNHVINHRNGSYIRSLRYCRDQPGLLAVLSSAGELQVFCTQREFVEPFSENDVDGTPELLEVRKSYPIQYPFFDENFGCPHDQRVVSSDWAALGSPELQPRVVTRRWNQKLEVMLMPTTTQHHTFDLINFPAKARRENLNSLEEVLNCD
jgi:WD repeat-containing protein mio